MGSRKPTRRRAARALVPLLSVCLVIAACSGSDDAVTEPSGTGDSQSAEGSTSTGPPGTVAVPVEVPQPPAPAPTPAGTVEEQAATVAAAVAQGGEESVVSLLTAYSLSGLGVLDDRGAPLAGMPDNPVGPPWWLVHAASFAAPTSAVTLDDFARIFLADVESREDLAPQLAAAVLADLRAMAQSQQETERFFAHYLAERARRGSGSELLDPAVTPADAKIDPSSAVMLAWAVLRSVVVQGTLAEQASPPSSSGLFLVATRAPAPRVQAAGGPCTESGMTEQVTFWVNWIGSKITGGVQLPGMESGTKSAADLLVRDPDVAKKLSKGLGLAGGALNIATFAMQMGALTASVHLEPQELERTKTTTDGKNAKVTAIVKLDLEQAKSATGPANCLLALLNALGVSAQLPADGAISGASVEFQGGKGFGQGLNTRGAYVQFQNGASQIKQDTDGQGQVMIDVQGIRQNKDVPDAAVPWLREWSIRVSATPEKQDERSIVNTFWDSLTGVGAGPAGLIGPVVDVLKTVKYDLGEFFFMIKDWRVGWIHEDDTPKGRIVGTKCDGVGGEWVVSGEQTLGTITHSETWNITIDENSLTGSYTYEALDDMGNGITTIDNAQGTATIAIDENDGTVRMSLRDTSHTITTTVMGVSMTVEAERTSWSFEWLVASESDCPEE